MVEYTLFCSTCLIELIASCMAAYPDSKKVRRYGLFLIVVCAVIFAALAIWANDELFAGLGLLGCLSLIWGLLMYAAATL